MPKPSTSAAWSGWLEATSGIVGVELAAAVAPQQVDEAVVLARDEHRHPLGPAGVGEPRSACRAARRPPAANARPSAARSPCSSVNSIRMKNSPPSGSVECWSELMMFAPEAARKPATAATIPWRSGQVMSRRPFMRLRRLLRPAPATRARRAGGARRAAGSRRRRAAAPSPSIGRSSTPSKLVGSSRGTSVTASPAAIDAAVGQRVARDHRQPHLEARGADARGRSGCRRSARSSGSSASAASGTTRAPRAGGPAAARPGTSRCSSSRRSSASCSRRSSAAS